MSKPRIKRPKKGRAFHWRDGKMLEAKAASLDIPHIEPEPRGVAKVTIIRRLHEAGKLKAFRTALAEDDLQQELWNASDEVVQNDEAFATLLKKIKANPKKILAL